MRLWSLAAAGRLAGELLVVDDVDAMAAAVDEVLGPGEGQNLLELLVRTAPATGTGLVLTAPLSMAGARWASRIGLRLVLGAPQPAQASVAGLPRGVVTGSAPGRGVVIDGAVEAERALSVQVVTPCAPREATARSAHRLVAIPRTVAPLAGTWAVGGDDARPLPVPPAAACSWSDPRDPGARRHWPRSSAAFMKIRTSRSWRSTISIWPRRWCSLEWRELCTADGSSWPRRPPNALWARTGGRWRPCASAAI